MTDAASIKRAADWIEAEYGHLDVLVNNAGIATVARRGALASQTSIDEMRAVYEVNVSSEVGSISGQTNPASPLAQMPASAQYPSSKAALNMLTVMYAKELKDTAIKVNAANPGYTAADFNRNSGFRTAAQGAEPSVYLATLPDDGPTGIHWGYLWTTDGTGGYGVIPW